MNPPPQGSVSRTKAESSLSSPFRRPFSQPKSSPKRTPRNFTSHLSNLKFSPKPSARRRHGSFLSSLEPPSPRGNGPPPKFKELQSQQSKSLEQLKPPPKPPSPQLQPQPEVQRQQSDPEQTQRPQNRHLQLLQLQKQHRHRHLQQKAGTEDEKKEVVEDKHNKPDPRLEKLSIKIDDEIKLIQRMCEKETNYARELALKREEEKEAMMKEVRYHAQTTVHEVLDIFMGETRRKQEKCRPPLRELRKNVSELVEIQRGICDDAGLVEECLLDFEEERRKNSTFMAIALLLVLSFFSFFFSLLSPSERGAPMGGNFGLGVPLLSGGLSKSKERVFPP